MPQSSDKTIYLKDYTPFGYILDDVTLTFDLHPTKTIVTSRISMRPNPDAVDRSFALHGVYLTLIWAKIDGQEIAVDIDETGLVADVPNAPFVWECQVEINPQANTVLDGLYMSGEMFSTQCEAEGFRRITFYPDRPDVMSIFTVRINSDLPVLLSNGNPVESGDGYAIWHDPWPKPAYLFALVAGNLVNHPDNFTTQSGRNVALNIWVDESDLGKCAYAMDALKRSMKWDEDVYGREYDLDIFNIVAVHDFNSGAMENKGLNIFNSKLVLASPETATDRDYELIEGVIAHEYFHNWTGNRITCRDWFQLCLKEGLTVFRDQQFSGDMRGHALKRIDDVLGLRAAQFKEDAGPLAHAVRPESFVEINNFYTATVYEKGAEVIAMLKLLVGDAAYAKALDLYFERHDGQATTIEAWIKVFEDATGRELSHFKQWYSQAGTPKLEVREHFEGDTFTLEFAQSTAATPGQPTKKPQVIPIAVGLLDDTGQEVVGTTILEMDQERQSFAFEGLKSRPTASILRGFSAPVNLARNQSTQERAFLLAHDTDPFNKWEAGRMLAKDVLCKMATASHAPVDEYISALGKVLSDDTLLPGFKAVTLALPSQDDLAQTLFELGTTPDPSRIYEARQDLLQKIATDLGAQLSETYDQNEVTGAFSADAGPAGKRALRTAALGLLSKTDQGTRARALFDAADNMTEQFAALANLVLTSHGQDALASFYDQWQHERLVMDKWFLVQGSMAQPDKALGIVQGLENHPDFNWKNPNRWRSLMNGIVTGNPAAFHQVDGSSYRWFADWLLRVDAANPQLAARASSFFGTWGRYDADRKGLIHAELLRILATENLSSDTREMITRIEAG